MPPPPPLTGIPLAVALFTARLAPPRVFAQGGGYWYPDTLFGPIAWQPWRTIADCWHLVLRYRMDVWLSRFPGEGSSVSVALALEEVADDADLPAAIGRLALRLRATEPAPETP